MNVVVSVAKMCYNIFEDIKEALCVLSAVTLRPVHLHLTLITVCRRFHIIGRKTASGLVMS
jgi:hypothetical protein